jgi:hypothetical protein
MTLCFSGRLTEKCFGSRQFATQHVDTLKIYLERDGTAFLGIQHDGNPTVSPGDCLGGLTVTV